MPHYLRHHRHAVVLAGAHVARAVGEGGGGEAVLLAPPGYHHLYSLDLVIICNVITCRCPCSRSRAPWRDTCRPRLPQLRWWWRGPPWWGRAAPRCWRRPPGRWWWARCCCRCCRHLFLNIILLILQSFFKVTVGNSFRMFQCPTYNGDVCTRLERLHGSTGAVTGAPVAAVPAGQRGHVTLVSQSQLTCRSTAARTARTPRPGAARTAARTDPSPTRSRSRTRSAEFVHIVDITKIITLMFTLPIISGIVDIIDI